MKRRTYTATDVPLGAAYAPLGCGPATLTNMVNPNTGGSPVPLGTTFVAGPGGTLTNPHVNLIFWGGWWAGNPLAGEVVYRVGQLLAGPYMTYLAQYGVHRGDIRGTTYVVDREPGMAFTLENVGTLVTDLLDDDQLPEPDDNSPNIYAVFLPVNAARAGPAPGVTSPLAGQNAHIIWYDYDIGDVDNDPAHFLWVGNDGTIDYIMTVFSHELVEIVTDPNGGDGVVQVAPPAPATERQIADVGGSWCDYVPGGRAQSYWSIVDDALVLPKLYSVRRTLAGKSIGGKLPRTPSANAWIATQF